MVLQITTKYSSDLEELGTSHYVITSN
jgi:hypothetical protein